MTITETLAKFVIDTSYDSIPPNVISHAKDLALSNLGVMVWGSTLPAGKMLARMIKDMKAAPEAGVIGSGFKTTISEAALCGGNFAHAAEWEGDSRPEMVGVMTIFPVVFPLGEMVGATGKEVIAAAVIGHEVSSRIGLACLPATDRGFFAVPVFGNFGSCIAAAKLLKLTKEQIMVAMALAASQSAGTLRQHDTMAHFVETGFATRNGVMATLLAKAGFNSDMNILEDTNRGLGFCSAVAGKEGFHIEKVTGTLGKEWRFILLDSKNFPVHSYQQRPLEAAVKLVNEHKIDYKDVDTVEIEIKPAYAHALDLLDPQDGEHARVSFQHGIAAALLEKKIDMSSFTDAKAASGEFKEARRKVKLVPRPDWEKEPKDFETVTIKLKNGQKYSATRDAWRGHHTEPFTKEELISKYKKATDGTLSPRQVERSMELAFDLEKQKNVAELMKILTFPEKK